MEAFIGLPAEVRFEVRGHVCSEYRHNTLVQQSEPQDPLEIVKGCQARFKAAMARLYRENPTAAKQAER